MFETKLHVNYVRLENKTFVFLCQYIVFMWRKHMPSHLLLSVCVCARMHAHFCFCYFNENFSGLDIDRPVAFMNYELSAKVIHAL